MSECDYANTLGWLGSADRFQTLKPSTLEGLARISVNRHIARGHLLFSEGSHAAFTYIVTKGSFRSISNDWSGREQTLSVESRESILGLAASLSAGTYHSTVLGAEPSSVLCIDSRTLVHLCRTTPDLLWAMTLALAAQVKSYGALATMLGLRSADEKLAMHLVAVALERSVQSADGLVFELKATRPEIAAQLGTVREVVSRSFSHLQAKGLIHARGRLITIPNLDALQRFSTRAGGNTTASAQA